MAELPQPIEQTSGEQQARALESTLAKSLLNSITIKRGFEIKSFLVKYIIESGDSDTYLNDELIPNGAEKLEFSEYEKLKPCVDKEAHEIGMETVVGFELEILYNEGTFKFTIHGFKNGQFETHIVPVITVVNYVMENYNG